MDEFFFFEECNFIWIIVFQRYFVLFLNSWIMNLFYKTFFQTNLARDYNIRILRVDLTRMHCLIFTLFKPLLFTCYNLESLIIILYFEQHIFGKDHNYYLNKKSLLSNLHFFLVQNPLPFTFSLYRVFWLCQKLDLLL